MCGQRSCVRVECGGSMWEEHLHENTPSLECFQLPNGIIIHTCCHEAENDFQDFAVTKILIRHKTMTHARFASKRNLSIFMLFEGDLTPSLSLHGTKLINDIKYRLTDHNLAYNHHPHSFHIHTEPVTSCVFLNIPRRSLNISRTLMMTNILLAEISVKIEKAVG